MPFSKFVFSVALGPLIVKGSKFHTHWNSRKHKRQAPMHSSGFEPAIPAIKQLQTYAWDRTTTEIGFWNSLVKYYLETVLITT
jgi:hypothetical protein